MTSSPSTPLSTLYLGELRMLLRDRRTILASVVLPLLFLPLVFWISSVVEKKREERIETRIFGYAVDGPRAELARELLAATGREEGSSVEDQETSEDETPDEETPDDGVRPDLRPSELECADRACWEEALRQREIHAVLLAREPEARADAEDAPDGRRDAAPPAVPRFEILYQGDWNDSETAARELRTRLREAREERRDRLLADAGFPVARDEVAPVAETRDLATAGQRGGRLLGRFAVLGLMMFLLTGGSIVAADTLAGEKERGTLETLLTSAASRGEIVVAKLLLIVTVGLFISLIFLANLAVYVGLDLFDLPEGFAVEITLVSGLWLLLLLVPLAVTLAAVLLLVSGRAKTYKEFQVSFLPVMLLLLVPCGASMLPGIDLRSAIVVVPLSNLAVAVREVLVGEIDWLFLSLTFLVSSAVAGLLVRWTLESLETERLVTATDVDEATFLGGEGLFRRHLPAWFGVFWATIFVAGTWYGESVGIRAQVAINVILVMGGGTFLMIRRYGLDAKKVLALRMPSPWAWPAVVLGAPAFLLTGVAVGKLSNVFFPVPERVLEAFGRQLLPQDVPTWQLFVFIAVFPGIFEEICFRGGLLYGLRKRFHPVVLCLVTGAVFGLFHMSLFRILPTAYLGVVLAAVTLLTGSLLPAMLWHALNNATAVALGMQGIDITQLDDGVYVAAGVAAALVLALLWRTRRLYPDLKTSRKPKRRSWS